MLFYPPKTKNHEVIVLNLLALAEEIIRGRLTREDNPPFLWIVSFRHSARGQTAFARRRQANGWTAAPDESLRIAAFFRYINPATNIRLAAGGRC